MLEELEKVYLEKNSKFKIEETLLYSLTLKEIQGFIQPLHTEYIGMTSEINETILGIKKKYPDLDELSKYAIKLLVDMELWWERQKELEKTLNRFNSHLYSRLPSKKRYSKQYRKIDINEIPITEVISRYIKLPSNLRRNFKCPIHNEKTWSFKIYPETNSWFCFWCNKGWNAINFISEMEGIGKKEAFKRLIDYFNL